VSFDARNEKLVFRIYKFYANNLAYQFYLGAELLNLTVFSLIFEARKKIISAFERVIPCLDFSFLPDF